MPFNNFDLFHSGGVAGAAKEQRPESEVAEKIAKAKQARKDGQALRAGKPKSFNNRRWVSR